ncbi:MAG: zf-TFIIB domain-containing protein [Sandaracinaceae bacterium]
MSRVCEHCAGALEPGMAVPPCLCELGDLLPYVSSTNDSSAEPTREPGELVARPGTSGEAKALKCPGCGAFLDAGMRRCSYCKIELASVRCWRCFTLSFAGMSHCSRCGASLGLEGDAGATPYRCATCEGDVLHVIDVGDHRIEECPACTSVMVDHETLGQLTRRTELAGGVRFTDSKRSTLDLEAVRYRSCPKCDEVMTRQNFGRRSGVIVDVCTKHGVWFDPQELTAILEFVATGGLQVSRQRELEDGAERLRRQRLEALRVPHGLAGAEGPSASSTGAFLSVLGLLDW